MSKSVVSRKSVRENTGLAQRRNETDEINLTVNAKIVTLVAEISELMGSLSVGVAKEPSLKLRRTNLIRTIQGSLAIEGNTLSEEQITAILAGKRVLAPAKDILEARNALATYDQLDRFKPTSRTDLLRAHKILMQGLLEHAGKFRTSGVGVAKGVELVHLAPPANLVPAHINRLLGWLKATDQHPLIASCVFHYEFEFIHPFADGNGRMGRLWQTLILMRWNPIFSYLPVENLVHANQTKYYHALNQSTKNGDCAAFVEFMLIRILESLQTFGKEEIRKKYGRTEMRILTILKTNANLTGREIAAKLKMSQSAIEKNLAKLQKVGAIQHEGSTKGGVWVVLGDTP